MILRQVSGQNRRSLQRRRETRREVLVALDGGGRRLEVSKTAFSSFWLTADAVGLLT